jgi:hypothetical protein
MSLPLHVWSALGREAWDAGQLSIRTGSFVLVQDADDMAYVHLKQYAASYAKPAIVRLHSTFPLTPAQRVRLTGLYVHAFVNGAFDEILSAQPPTL